MLPTAAVSFLDSDRGELPLLPLPRRHLVGGSLQPFLTSLALVSNFYKVVSSGAYFGNRLPHDAGILRLVQLATE